MKYIGWELELGDFDFMSVYKYLYKVNIEYVGVLISFSLNRIWIIFALDELITRCIELCMDICIPLDFHPKILN